MNERRKLFTCSYRAALAAAPPLVVVRISIGKPRWLAPAQADAMPFVAELAPFGAFHIADDAEFERAYRARLERMGIDRIERRFEGIAREHRGRPLALCCFELDPADCHRSTFARWWLHTTGERVSEWGAGGR